MNIYSILEKKLENNDINIIYNILSFVDYKLCPICKKYEDKNYYRQVFYHNCNDKILICNDCNKNYKTCTNCQTKHHDDLITYSKIDDNPICRPCLKYYERRHI